MRLFLVLFLGMIALGCHRNWIPFYNVQPSIMIRDSIVNTVHYKDTVIITPASELHIKSDLKSFVNGFKQSVSTERMKLDLKVANDTVDAKCECDSNAIKIRLYERLLQRYSSSHLVHPPIKEKYIPGFMKVMMWIGIAAIVGSVIFIIKKFVAL